MRTSAAAAAVLFSVLALGACGNRVSAPEKPRKIVVALIMKSLANDFFQNMERGAREHQAAHRDEYDLVINGIKNESDISGQIRLVEHMVAQKVDAIVIAPADSKALVSVCAEAAAAGVAVVNIDNRLDARIVATKGIHIPFAGPDNRKGARRVAAQLSLSLPPGSEVAIIEGIPTALNSIDRTLGFREGFEAAGMRVVASESGEWDMAKANALAASLLRKHPGLRGLACANDAMALGAVAAAKSAGRGAEKLAIAGFDNIAAAGALIREGRLVATAEQYPGGIAAAGIDRALDMVRTGVLVSDRETPIDVITRSGPAPKSE